MTRCTEYNCIIKYIYHAMKGLSEKRSLKSLNSKVVGKNTSHLEFFKELSFCHNFKFSNFYISAISGYKPLIFQT